MIGSCHGIIGSYYALNSDYPSVFYVFARFYCCVSY